MKLALTANTFREFVLMYSAKAMGERSESQRVYERLDRMVRRGLAMNEQQKQAVYDCIRECLWMARVWNDHNFTYDVIREKAKKAADSLECATVEEANAFLDLLQDQLDA